MQFVFSKAIFRKYIRWAAGAVGVAFLLFLFVQWRVFSVSSPFQYEKVDQVPHAQAVLILGARVYADGRMSDILRDRVLTALSLYKNGTADVILVSGDHGRKEYDEVGTIRKFLLESGVPPKAIFLDHAGFDTYDSLYRAQKIFEVQSLVIATQKFHLSRALYIARSLGIRAYGVEADRQTYVAAAYNEVRESFSRVKAFLNVQFHAKPQFLGDTISIAGDGRKSWD